MLIFFDIDGTLIGEQSHMMLESTKKAIQKARSNGHICIVNTGRSKKLVGPEFTSLTEFDGYLMGCGTQIIYRGKELSHKTFTVQEAEEIIAALGKYHIDAVLEGAENNFVNTDDRIYTDTFRRFVHYFDSLNFGNYEDAAGKFDKFYTYAPQKENLSGFKKEFENRLDFVDRGMGYYEITPKGYSKASAMKMLAERLEIPMTETVAIGDSGNDISMIQYAQIGIAMGNAFEEVKQIADYVTTDVEDDGIMNALKWLGAI